MVGGAAELEIEPKPFLFFSSLRSRDTLLSFPRLPLAVWVMPATLAARLAFRDAGCGLPTEVRCRVGKVPPAGSF